MIVIADTSPLNQCFVTEVLGIYRVAMGEFSRAF